MLSLKKVRAHLHTRLSGTRKTQIVVIGGGIGGLELVTHLGRALGSEQFNVILVERKLCLEVIDEGRLTVTLIEAGSRIVPALSEKLPRATREELAGTMHGGLAGVA